MIHGKSIIGYSLAAESSKRFRAFGARTNAELPEEFHSVTKEVMEKAVHLANEAYHVYKNKPGKEKAVFLRSIASNIEAIGTALIERAMLETGLSEGRLTGERTRTINQLRLFASLLEEGYWVDASIDQAIPDRKPLPRVDIRKMLKPIGTVVIFTASNFPLAFSTAGGDTASALAAGCPVIVKAHPYHLGTNELVAMAIMKAAKENGMPEGVFSSINTNEYEISHSLVKHPLVKAVAFTGSYAGGMALYKFAQEREEPIPVFAEMGSVNPVILLPGKLKSDGKTVAEAIAGSITLGAGQYCTNPGILIALSGKKTDSFIEVLSSRIKSAQPETMLNAVIKKSYDNKTRHIIEKSDINIIAQAEIGESASQGRPMVARINGNKFIANPHFAEEIFGPYSLLIECKDYSELFQVVKSFKGQLTSTIMATPEDVEKYKLIIDTMQEIVGRLIFNGVPTGVEVCYAMQHGGTFPASTDGRFTSVGTDAIRRFVRPVAFQDAPDSYLPDELKDTNPLKIWRLVDGELTKNEVKRRI